MGFKKILLFPLAALCLGSCSAGGSAKPCDVEEKFHSAVTVTSGEKQYQATIQRADADVWEMEFSQPDTVAGMKLNFTGKVCTLEFQGLKYEMDRADVSPYSMATSCCDAIEELINKRGITCEKKGDILTERGEVDGQSFTASFKKGKLKELTVSDQLKYKFSPVK